MKQALAQAPAWHGHSGAQPGGWGCGSTLARPQPCSAQVVPQAPCQSLVALHLQNLSAEECAAPSAAGTGWL